MVTQGGGFTALNLRKSATGARFTIQASQLGTQIQKIRKTLRRT